MAAGRCKLLLTAFEDVLAKMDVPITSAADVWTIIARFAFDDEEVGAVLANVGELLALPPRQTIVRKILVALVDKLSKPNVQQRLQDLLTQTRKEESYAKKESYAGLVYGSRKLFADGSDAMAAGRCELVKTAFEDVLANMGIPIASAADVWTIIARLALDDEEVGALLATVGELLALPPGQTIVKTILGALVNNRSKPNVQQRLQDLLILLTR